MAVGCVKPLSHDWALKSGSSFANLVRKIRKLWQSWSKKMPREGASPKIFSPHLSTTPFLEINAWKAKSANPYSPSYLQSLVPLYLETKHYGLKNHGSWVLCSKSWKASLPVYTCLPWIAQSFQVEYDSLGHLCISIGINWYVCSCFSYLLYIPVTLHISI